MKTRLVESSKPDRELMIELGTHMGDDRLRAAIGVLTDLQQQIRTSPDPQLALEMALVRLAPSAKTTTKKAAPANTEAEQKPIVTLARVEAAWPTLLAKLKKSAFSTYLLLLESELVEVAGKTIRIGFANEYHQQQMRKKEIIAALRQQLREVLGSDIEVECVMEKQAGKKTVAVDAPSAMDLLRDNFGAEIVEDHDN